MRWMNKCALVRVAFRALTWILCSLATTVFIPPSLAADAADVTKALPAITDTANAICAAVTLAGSTHSASVSGDIKVQLDSLLRKIANIGVATQGALNTSSYQGVLQSDLATALRDENDCKFRVFNKLTDTLFPPSGTVQANYSGYKPTGEFDTELQYYLALTGVRTSVLQMTESLLQNIQSELLKEYPDRSDIVRSVMSATRQEMPNFINEVIDSMSPIMKKHFTVNEIQELNKFYSTTVMRDMIRKMPQVMQEFGPIEMQLTRQYQDRLSRRLQMPNSR